MYFVILDSQQESSIKVELFKICDFRSLGRFGQIYQLLPRLLRLLGVDSEQVHGAGHDAAHGELGVSREHLSDCAGPALVLGVGVVIDGLI